MAATHQRGKRRTVRVEGHPKRRAQGRKHSGGNLPGKIIFGEAKGKGRGGFPAFSSSWQHRSLQSVDQRTGAEKADGEERGVVRSTW